MKHIACTVISAHVSRRIQEVEAQIAAASKDRTDHNDLKINIHQEELSFLYDIWTRYKV